jgi:putative flippase GtrA
MPWLFNISVQLIKFAVIGAANTVIGYGIFYALIHFHFHYLFALLASSVFGITNSYFWNKYWVFTSEHHFKRELPRFIIVYLGSLMINAALLPVFVEMLKIDPTIAQLFFLFFLPLFTFAGLKYWSFA